MSPHQDFEHPEPPEWNVVHLPASRRVISKSTIKRVITCSIKHVSFFSFFPTWHRLILGIDVNLASEILIQKKIDAPLLEASFCILPSTLFHIFLVSLFQE